MMKTSKNSRKALMYLLLSTGIIAGHPFSAMADDNVSEVKTVQQQIQVAGVVNDAMGPVIGASVLEKGTTNGVITDFDGRFALNVRQGATLVISYVGYKTQEVKVVAGKEISVLLAEDTETLDEVVVVGFGTQKKVNLTGAVGTVDSKALESRPDRKSVV